MNIKYIHTSQVHSVSGATAALPLIFSGSPPASLLDVGCGTGTWLSAARELGVAKLFGIDGATIDKIEFLIEKEFYLSVDLRENWNLNRRFDLVICLEVAEHLEETVGEHLIRKITQHGDRVVFSAACPEQPGQHHVNCQWPAYWQNLFNLHGFVCNDSIRWKIWNTPEIECWYRQNLFIAERNPDLAGKEPRIAPVIHPEMRSTLFADVAARKLERLIRSGTKPVSWYFSTFTAGLWNKLRRRFGYDTNFFSEGVAQKVDAA